MNNVIGHIEANSITIMRVWAEITYGKSSIS